jgi:TolB-like protein/DNA-binding SARP family transcriptional activator
MTALTIRLLGGFEARRGTGAPVDFPTKKARALLAYLALHPGRPHSRDALADLLWAEGGEQARGSLRRTLSDLRKAMGESAVLTSEGDVVALAPDGLEVDVEIFERLAAGDEPATQEKAVTLYQGDLLAGFGLREEAFEAWLRAERDRFRALVLQTLGKLVTQHAAANALDRSIDAAKRLLAIDPTSEPTYRALMSLYARQGHRSEALKQYRVCCDALMRELGVKPDPATQQLYRDLQKPDIFVSPPKSSSDDMVGDAPPLPGKPSIAVLPFANMSDEADHEFFADGLTEDIIAALSRISALWVIARASTFTYKGKPTDVKQVARELGVRYVMEGSVRRSGNRLRVAAQLADASTGREVWAERYDRPLADLFDIQDEITRSVAATTETQVVLAEAQFTESVPPKDLKARDLVARALSRRYDQTPEAEAEAYDLAEEALRLDPAYPIAHRVRAGVVLGRLWSGELPHTAENKARAMELARTALKLAPRDELAHLVMAWAWAYAASGRLEDALAECDRGLEINPNCSLIMANKGVYLAALGRSQEAIDISHLALRLNPRDPSNFWRHYGIAVARFVSGDYAASLDGSRKIARSRSHLPSGIIWAAAAAALDDQDEARAAIDYCLSRKPQMRLDRVAPDYMLRFARPEDHERLLAMLRKAGMPE